MATRRKFWGWGVEDQLRARSNAARSRALFAARFGTRPARVGRAAARSRRSRCAPRGWRRRRASRRSARRAPDDRAGHTYGKSFRDVVRALRARLRRTRPTSSRSRASEARRRRGARLVRAARGVAAIPYGGGSSVVGGVEAPRRRRATRGVVSIDLGAPRPRARDRPRLARRAHPGRRARPGARGPAPAARPHAAPLPAVVRVLDARRLDRDALRRPLRDALHAHRRLRRVAARGHADAASSRRAACPARAPGPSPDRLFIGSEGTSASSPRRGCACRTGRRFRAVGVGHASPTSRAGARAVRALAQAGLYPANCRLLDPGRGADRRRGRRRATPCCCSPSSRPTTRSTPGWRARSSAAATTAAACPPDAGATRTRRRAARARAPPAPGATRSSTRPTCATRSSRMGMISETFETAITWDRFAELPRRRDGGDARTRVQRVCGAGQRHLPLHARLSRRPGALLHGASRRRGAASQLEQWAEIKAAASEALHPPRRHDHAPPRRRPRPPPVVRPRSGPTASRARSRAAKRALDPARHPEPRRAHRSLTPAACRESTSGSNQPGGGAWRLHEYRE